MQSVCADIWSQDVGEIKQGFCNLKVNHNNLLPPSLKNYKQCSGLLGQENVKNVSLKFSENSFIAHTHCIHLPPKDYITFFKRTSLSL